MWRNLFSKVLFSIFVLSAAAPLAALGQTVHQDLHETVSAEVIEVVREDERMITGTDTVTMEQEVRVELKSGELKGEVTTIINEVVRLEVGDKIFVNRMVNIRKTEFEVYL